MNLVIGCPVVTCGKTFTVPIKNDLYGQIEKGDWGSASVTIPWSEEIHDHSKTHL